jgi:iron complex outermembrane recepter protein
MSRIVFAAATAAGLCVAVSSALAQDVSTATAGGDVTADEATPLPPIVVQSPKEPIVGRRRAKGTGASSAQSTAAASDGSEGSGATAVEGEGPAIGIFTLGQLDMIGGSTITNEAMWTFNTQSLDKAVELAPGVSSHTGGGRRNERDIYVRGFDRFRVPLSIDGVRVYLPADNRLDMSRFLTPDLSEVQIQKGYVSVLNGPGGLGGAINMVSRKPTKEFEAEARAGVVMNGDVDDLNQWSSYAYMGTRKKGYYAQISGTIVDQDHFNLSDDFRPATPSTPFDPYYPYEQGGNRDHSDFSDWRINAKVGITPNATDEYSINYTTQSGEKSAPLHIRKEQFQTQRYWEWPYWDIASLSWLSKTQIGSASYIKTNVYYNTFENRLSSFDAPSATVAPYSQQTAGYTFNSDYEDFAYGGFLELGTELIPMNTLKGAIHYRSDNHAERNFGRPDHPTQNFVEPWQENIEDTWSFALENTFHASKRLDFIAGVSYDYQDVKSAEDFTNNAIVQNELTTNHAWNYQGGAVYRFSNTGDVHATVSSRTRFATVFERYSTRFGYAIPNPNLEAERATNWELGATETLFNEVRVSGALFYSDLKDSIQSAYIIRPDGSVFSQNQNVNGTNYGAELSVDWDIAPGLRIGGNYTYLERNYDYITPGTKPEGTPSHEGFLYLSWDATPKLTITPSLSLASDRTSFVTSGTTRSYIETGSFALANLQAEYKFSENVSAAIGATNIFDENYSLVEGFPEAGRQFFANGRVKF